MKYLPFALAACMAASAPAWSLSCMRPDIIRTYEAARDSDAGFWIVQGEIFTDQPIALPKPDASGRYKDGTSASTPIVFSGLGLLPDGMYKGFAQNITLTLTCVAHWCGSAPLDQKVFVAIEVKDTGPELLLDPCNSRVVPYTEEANQRLLACVRNGDCQYE